MSNSQEVARPNKALVHIKELQQSVAQVQAELGKSLPGHITPEKFVRTAQTAIAHTRNIDKCTNPRALVTEISKAAADGLILDGREAALVIDYNGNPQYRPMMRGLLKLAHNSGQIKSITVEVVRDGDHFIYEPTNADKPIEHKIDLKAARGDVYAVYAFAVLLSGGIVKEVMSVAAVNKIRDRSDAWKAFKAQKIKSTPWSTDWEEMARKTVFRRISKYLPSSSDREDRLNAAAERIDADYTFDDPPVDDTTTGDPTGLKKRGAAKGVLKDVTPKKAAQEQQQEPDADPDGEPDPETGEYGGDSSEQGEGDEI